MTLETLRELRRSGGKPDSLIKVIVGRKSDQGERHDVIVVSGEDQPQRMDWRPVIGLPVAIFVATGADPMPTAEAIIAAGGQLKGSAWGDSETSADESIKPVLRQMWDVLCS